MPKIYLLVILGLSLASASERNVRTDSRKTVSEINDSSLNRSYSEEETIEMNHTPHEILNKEELHENKLQKKKKDFERNFITSENKSSEDLSLWNKIHDESNQLDQKLQNAIQEYNTQKEKIKKSSRQAWKEKINQLINHWNEKFNRLENKLNERHKKLNGQDPKISRGISKLNNEIKILEQNLKEKQEKLKELERQNEKRQNDNSEMVMFESEKAKELNQMMLELSEDLSSNSTRIKSLEEQLKHDKESIKFIAECIKEFEQIFRKKDDISARDLREWATKAQNEHAKRLKEMLNSQQNVVNLEESQLKELKRSRKKLKIEKSKLDQTYDQF